jgi:hypothetical protein
LVRFQLSPRAGGQPTPEQKIRCQTAQSSCALARQGEKDSIASIDDNKITQRIGDWWTVKIVAGCSETLTRSQQTTLAARSESD